jgi:organic radical activating enzyme
MMRSLLSRLRSRVSHRHALANLEIHVSHACNLSCESCSHYSNHNHKGMVSLDEARRWLEPWSRRLRPATFSLLGGEPATHPDLSDFIPMTRNLWPRAQIRLVSNGLLLHRHPELPKRLSEAGDAVLEVSLHHRSQAYARRIEPVLALLREWRSTYRIQIRLTDSFSQWTRRYKGYGAAMEPFEDDDPRLSWENCPARYCRQIVDGKLFKCGPLAYLPMQQQKFGLSEKWQPYLAYRPLNPDCPDEELAEFLGYEEESYCRMCAADPPRFELPLPIRGVKDDRVEVPLTPVPEQL